MILIAIDRKSGTPVYRQVCDGIVALIESGVLEPGDRLPTSRGLAATLGIHRSTVVRAYDEIRALGYLESAPGSYTTVRRRVRPPASHTAPGRPRGAALVNWRSIASAGVRNAGLRPGDPGRPFGSAFPAGTIDFDTLAADPTLAPDDELRRCIKTVLVRRKHVALDYTDPAGWLPLRERLASRLRSHGIAVSPEEVVVTAGAQQALDLILRMLVGPGDRVAVEAPSYGMAHALLRLHRARSIEVPMRADGMDLGALEKVLPAHKPKLVYTMPNFHNPMGITTDQAHRECLLHLCELHRTPLVEDGFEEEMKYHGKAVLPIKSMDTGDVVLYVGTFSKVVFSGLRMGWVAAPPVAARQLAGILHASCLSVNTLAQAALERFCAGGQFEAYLRRIHGVYRRRMQAMLSGLAAHVPEGGEWTKPAGGYTLWLTLPGSFGSEEALCDEFKRAGVAVAPGSRFFARKRGGRPAFRLSIACVHETAIEDGCRRLGGVLSKIAARSGYGKLRRRIDRDRIRAERRG